ncbi:MAG: glycoside hydrolase family 3 N-terminal domain-containing protein, partial [Planctomycetota bacterium]
FKSDINLAPVLDVVGPIFNPSITVRSFGNKTNVVSEMGRAMIEGMMENGVLPVARHFPGLGSATVDPRLKPAVVSLSGKDLKTGHVAPFAAAIESDVPIIMTSHAQYPSLDPTPDTPATFSEKIVTELLREGLKFQGVIMTDDLSMRSVTSLCGVPQAVVRAVQAGCDILMVAHDVDAQWQAFDAYRRAAEQGMISPGEMQTSRMRIQMLINRADATKPAGPVDTDMAETLSRSIAWDGLSIRRDPLDLIPVPATRHTAVVVPRLGHMAARYPIQESLRETGAFVQSWMEREGHDAHVLEIPADPPQGDIKAVVNWATTFDTLVHLCFDATRIAGQKRLLQLLQSHPRVICVVIHHPWDDALVPKNMSVLHTHGFQSVQIEAALDMIFRGR